MSEFSTGDQGEIGVLERQSLVTRILEILPEPTPKVGTFGEEEIRVLAEHEGKTEQEPESELEQQGALGKDYKYWEARATHTLDGESIHLEWTKSDDGEWSVYVSVSSSPIQTREGVTLTDYTGYRINPHAAAMRVNVGLSKGTEDTTEEALLEIFTPKYLAPILEEYKSRAVRNGKKPFSQKDYWELIAKLDRLGPDTEDADLY